MKKYSHSFVILLFELLFNIVLLLILPAYAEPGLKLPEQVTIIQKEAFYQDTSLDVVVLPDKLTCIEDLAFAYSSVKQINLPDSLTYISDNAFLGAPLERVTASPDTYAYNWAVSHKYISRSRDAFIVANWGREVTLESKSGRYSAAVFASGEWTVESDVLWLSFPDKHSEYVNVEVDENPGIERTGKITFRCGDDVFVTTITQKAKTGEDWICAKWGYSRVELDELVFPAENEEYVLYVYASDYSDWNATTEEQWFTVEKHVYEEHVYEDEDGADVGHGFPLHIRTENNETGTKRDGTVTLTCGKAEKVIRIKQATEKTEIKEGLDTDQIHFPAVGGSIQVEMKADQFWCEPDTNGFFPSWLKVTPSSGEGDNMITITAEPNGMWSYRHTTLQFYTVGAKENEYTIRITQDASEDFAEFAIGRNQTIEIPGEAGELLHYLIYVSSIEKATISCDADWIRYVQIPVEEPHYHGVLVSDWYLGMMGAVSLNDTGSARTGTITLTCGSASDTLTIIQQPVQPDELEIEWNEDESVLYISTNESWELSSDCDWLFFDGELSMTGDPNPDCINVGFKPYPEGEPREAAVTVKTRTQETTVIITQEAREDLEVEWDSQASENERLIIRSSNYTSWEVSSNCDWVSFCKSSDEEPEHASVVTGRGDDRVDVLYRYNEGNKPRKAVITVKTEYEEKKINVIQEAESAGRIFLSWDEDIGRMYIYGWDDETWNVSTEEEWVVFWNEDEHVFTQSVSGEGDGVIDIRYNDEEEEPRDALIWVETAHQWGEGQYYTITQKADGMLELIFIDNQTDYIDDGRIDELHIISRSEETWNLRSDSDWVYLWDEEEGKFVQSLAGKGDTVIKVLRTLETYDEDEYQEANITAKTDSEEKTIQITSE